MKQILILLLLLLILVSAALFVGKTSLNLDTMKFKIERPLTALLFFATLLAAMIEEKIIERFF